MANIYEAYQQYLSDIGEYVPSVDDVYSGVPRLASTIQNAGITGITGIKDALLPSGDDGNQGPPGPPGSPGTGGIAGLIDQYNNAGFLGRAPVNMAIGMLVPPLAPLLGMYNMGRSAYDGISGLMGGLKTTGFGNFTGGLFGAPEGRDEFGKAMNVGDVESGLDTVGGYTGTVAQQEALMSEMSTNYGDGESSGAAGTGNSNASEHGGSDTEGSS